MGLSDPEGLTTLRQTLWACSRLFNGLGQPIVDINRRLAKRDPSWAYRGT